MLLAQTVDYTTNSSADAAAVGITLIIFLVFGLIYLGVFIWAILAILDVNKYPDTAWAAAGQNKQTWLILNIVALFTCLLITAFYWFSVRPKVRAAAGMG